MTEKQVTELRELLAHLLEVLGNKDIQQLMEVSPQEIARQILGVINTFYILDLETGMSDAQAELFWTALG